MAEHDNKAPRPPRPMMSEAQVLKIVPVSPSTLKRMSEDGRFPARHQVSHNRVAYFSDEVADWQTQLSTDPILKRRLARRPPSRKRASEQNKRSEKQRRERETAVA